MFRKVSLYLHNNAIIGRCDTACGLHCLCMAEIVLTAFFTYHRYKSDCIFCFESLVNFLLISDTSPHRGGVAFWRLAGLPEPQNNKINAALFYIRRTCVDFIG